MKQIHFRTKEESKREQEELFLALTPSERFLSFVQMLSFFNAFETKHEEKTDNFVLVKEGK